VSGLYGPAGVPKRLKAGVPASAANEVHEVGIRFNVNGGTFTLTVTPPTGLGNPFTTGAIAWNALPTAVRDAINTAAGATVCASNTTTNALQQLPASVAIEFVGAWANLPVPLMTATSSLTVSSGVAATIPITERQAGTPGDGVGAQPGDLHANSLTGDAYVNTGSAAAPYWIPYLAVSGGRGEGRRAMTVAHTGDSITGNGAQYSPSVLDHGVGTWTVMAARRANNAVRLVRNAGVPSDMTAQVVERFERDVLPFGADTLVALMGVNDITSATPSLIATKQNVDALYQKCRKYGIRPIIGTLTGNNFNEAGGGYNKRPAITDINVWLADYCHRRGIALIDLHGATSDFRGYWTNWAAGGAYSTDGTHPVAAGHDAMATAVAAVWTGTLKGASPPIIDNLADYGSAPFVNMLGDGLFQTTITGSSSPWKAMNANLPTSQTTASGIFGNQVTLTFAAALLTGIQQIINAGATTFVAGDELLWTGKYQTVAGGAGGAASQILMFFYDGANQSGNQLASMRVVSTTGYDETGQFAANVVVPAGTASILIFEYAAASGATLKVSQQLLWNRTKAYAGTGIAMNP
jgi:lysophospholipase L1-like esterase